MSNIKRSKNIIDFIKHYDIIIDLSIFMGKMVALLFYLYKAISFIYSCRLHRDTKEYDEYDSIRKLVDKVCKLYRNIHSDIDICNSKHLCMNVADKFFHGDMKIAHDMLYRMSMANIMSFSYCSHSNRLVIMPTNTIPEIMYELYLIMLSACDINATAFLHKQINTIDDDRYEICFEPFFGSNHNDYDSLCDACLISMPSMGIRISILTEDVDDTFQMSTIDPYRDPIIRVGSDRLIHANVEFGDDVISTRQDDIQYMVEKGYAADGKITSFVMKATELLLP